jgi:hypothetical protein
LPEYEDASHCEDLPQRHRARTVNVMVAAYRPVATSGSGDENPILVAQMSPLPALGASFVPTVSAPAGGMGIGTRLPPASGGPSVAPDGAVAAIARGRSRGAKAVRATASE